jgi:hypothetical protein
MNGHLVVAVPANDACHDGVVTASRFPNRQEPI